MSSKFLFALLLICITSCTNIEGNSKNSDSFVSLEETLQKAAISHLERGDAVKRTLTSELYIAKHDREDPTYQKAQKISYLMNIINMIDQETGRFIELTEKIKKIFY